MRSEATNLNGPLPIASLTCVIGIGLRQPLRHDRAIDLGQRVRQQRERLLQTEADHLVGRRRELVGARHQRLAERIRAWRSAGSSRHSRAPAPACRRGMQARRAASGPTACRRSRPLALDHLRLHVELGIVAVQRVVDREREVAGDVGRRPHRIERGEIGVRREVDGLAPLRPARCAARPSAVAPASADFRTSRRFMMSVSQRIDVGIMLELQAAGRASDHQSRTCASAMRATPRPPPAPRRPTCARRHGRHRAR